jgi:hypothetical protein
MSAAMMTTRPPAKYIVHAVGLLLVVAGIATWAHLLYKPAPQAPVAGARKAMPKQTPRPMRSPRGSAPASCARTSRSRA